MLLVRQVLANTISNRNGTLLEFNYCDRNAVYINDKVRAFGTERTANGHLFGNGKMVVGRIFKINVIDADIFAIRIRNRMRILQQIVNRLVRRI